MEKFLKTGVKPKSVLKNYVKLIDWEKKNPFEKLDQGENLKTIIDNCEKEEIEQWNSLLD